MLVLNRRLLERAHDGWDEEHVTKRAEALIGDLVEIWTVPEGHTTIKPHAEHRRARRVLISSARVCSSLGAPAVPSPAGCRGRPRPCCLTADTTWKASITARHLVPPGPRAGRTRAAGPSG